MIIKRKYFTRQEQKAVKEIYNALKKGNIGRNLSAKDFVKARHVSNETIDALTGSGKIADFAKNEEVIKNLGLPETSKAYKRMIEKYTNLDLHSRFLDIQGSSSNNKLRRLRFKKKNTLESDLKDPYTVKLKYRKESNNNMSPKEKSSLDKYYRDNLKQIWELKKKRGIKNPGSDINKISNDFDKEKKDLENKIKSFERSGNKESKSIDPELAQKVIKDQKKKGVKFTYDPKIRTSHNRKTGLINLNNKGDRKDPSTILHKHGHKLSNERGETRINRSRRQEKLSTLRDTSENLRSSINNRVSDLAKLTEEANASYHAAAREGKYGATKERMKASKKNLDNAFRTYELNKAFNMRKDSDIRKIGRRKNK